MAISTIGQKILINSKGYFLKGLLQESNFTVPYDWRRRHFVKVEVNAETGKPVLHYLAPVKCYDVPAFISSTTSSDKYTVSIQKLNQKKKPTVHWVIKNGFGIAGMVSIYPSRREGTIVSVFESDAAEEMINYLFDEEFVNCSHQKRLASREPRK